MRAEWSPFTENVKCKLVNKSLLTATSDVSQAVLWFFMKYVGPWRTMLGGVAQTLDGTMQLRGHRDLCQSDAFTEMDE